MSDCSSEEGGLLISRRADRTIESDIVWQLDKTGSVGCVWQNIIFLCTRVASQCQWRWLQAIEDP